MNTHETYVNLETAKLLKQAGFDWEVEFFYQDGILKSVLPDVLFDGDFEDIEYYYKHIGIPHQSLNYNDGSSKFLEEYSAPTLAVAQRWLREVKDTIIDINSSYLPEGYGVNYCVHWKEPNKMMHAIEKSETSSFYKMFSTYEQALEEGIKTVLNLLKEEKSYD